MDYANFDYSKELNRKVNLSTALSNSYDLENIINLENKTIYKKNSKSLIREFNKDKWGILNKYMNQYPEVELEDLEKIEDGDQDSYFFYKTNFYQVSSSFFRRYLKHIILKHLLSLKNHSEIKTIVEIGAGYGSKLISIANSSLEFRKKDYFAFDISSNGLNINQFFARKYNLKLQTKLFDYRIQPFSDLGFKENSFLITCFGLHYKSSFTIKDIKEIVDCGFYGGFHFEPCYDFYPNIKDRLFSSLARKYMIINGYTLDIGRTFLEAKKSKLIEIKISNNFYGVGLLPCNLISWKVI